MTGGFTPLSSEQASVLARLARHEDAAVHDRFVHWQTLAVPRGSTTPGALVRRGLAERRELPGGIHYRTTTAGRDALRALSSHAGGRTSS
jgi:hypothetical protein